MNGKTKLIIWIVIALIIGILIGLIITNLSTIGYAIVHNLHPWWKSPN